MGWRDIIGPGSDSSSKWPGETARSTCLRRISSACGSMPPVVTIPQPIRSACRSCKASSSSISITPSRSSSARTAPANQRCWKGSRCSRATTRPVAAKATCRSIIPGAVEAMGGRLSRRYAQLAAEDHQWMVLPRRKLLLGRALSDRAALDARAAPPDFLSHSHGEGFLRFFEERCQRQGIFIFDEPESALSPSRQIEFLKLLRRMEQSCISK